MGKTLTFDLPDEIYLAIETMASHQGKTVEELALEWLVRHWPQSNRVLGDAERIAARRQLLRHAGAADSGDPDSGNNERIDVDLAREYGATHEDSD